MRLVAYRQNQITRLGLRDQGVTRDIGLFPGSSAAFGQLAQDIASGRIEPGAIVDGPITPGLPIVADARIICMGLNYAEHAREGGREPPAYPAFFFRVDTSLATCGASVDVQGISDKLDYEAELLVVIGQGGRKIPEARALDHVFGYGVFNDISVRDFQQKGAQWTPGKNVDGTGIVGPEIVTADEVPPGATGLGVRAVLNGAVMQDASTDIMIFPVARAIALVSEFMTLRPGDVIATGTPSGVGYARTPPVWMKPGDEIVVEVDHIGKATARIG
jgi:2-keto-4-pentenoate hydratase/2-oxohepta-3-ene-1,7-dioic acid hydratase in catechol pathway